jgi:hypothetical protein
MIFEPSSAENAEPSRRSFDRVSKVRIRPLVPEQPRLLYAMRTAAKSGQRHSACSSVFHSDPADRSAFLNRFMASSAPSQLADVVPRIAVQRMSGARSMLAAAASVRDRKAR